MKEIPPSADRPDESGEHLPVEAIQDAFAAVDEHNEHFSPGKQMAHGLFDALKRQRRQEELEDFGLSPGEAEKVIAESDKADAPFSDQQQMQGALIAIGHTDALETAGLTLRGHRTEYTPDDSLQYGQVKLELEDSEKFTNALREIAAQPESDEVMARLHGLIEKWGKDALTHVAFEEVTEQDAAFLTYAAEIAATMRDIGIADEELPTQLVEIVKYSKCIKEYANTQYVHLLEEPTPHSSHLSASHMIVNDNMEVLDAYWKYWCFDTLKNLRNNDDPQAQQLYMRALEGARKHLAFAKEDWPKIFESRNYYESAAEQRDRLMYAKAYEGLQARLDALTA